MTQQEFEQLTGTTVTAEEYSQIEKVYMMNDNMEKKEFCQMWMNTPEPAQDYMIDMANEIRIREEIIKSDNNDKKDLLDVMFERTQVMSDPVLRKECIKHMGEHRYILKLAASQHNFWEADRQLIAVLMANII